MDRIRTWDYRAEYDIERTEILDAVDRVFSSGRLILGDSVRAFESEFSAYCGVAHGVGVGNATDGLTLVLRALGIQSGDEVITVANTAVATVSAIVAAGATPRFVDIDPETYLMDASVLATVIGPRTRVVIPVHLFGQCADMHAVNAVAKAHDVAVIEDCAQAHGATQDARFAGSLGSRAGVFSFYPTKPLGAYGDAGLVVTNDEALGARVRAQRSHGITVPHVAATDGVNSRLDEVQAEILRVKLRRLDTYLAQRRAIAARYDELFAGSELHLPVTARQNVHAYYRYVVRHAGRDKLLADLHTKGVELEINYPVPIHLMPAYERLGYGHGSLPHTEEAAREIFSLPLYPTLDEFAQRRVYQALSESLGG